MVGYNLIKNWEVGKVLPNLVSVMTRMSTLPRTKNFNWSNLIDMGFIFRLPTSSLFIFFTTRLDK